MPQEVVKTQTYQSFGNKTHHPLDNDAPRPPVRAGASDIALRALVDLASNPRRLARFLGERGLDLDDLRRGALNPDLQAHALAHVTRDRGRINRFAQRSGLSVARVQRAASQMTPSPIAAVKDQGVADSGVADSGVANCRAARHGAAA